MVRRLTLAVVFVALPLASLLGLVQSAPPSASGLDLTALDRRVDPCADFYQFACGTWLDTHPIPADRSSWGRFGELQERNSETLRRILETAAKAGDRSTQKIGDYYASCMDEAAIEQKGTSPLDPDLARIDAVKAKGELPAVVAQLHASGVPVFFEFGASPDFKDSTRMIAAVGQGGLGLPDRDYYFRDDQRSLTIRRAYVGHVAEMLRLTRAADTLDMAPGEVVLDVETRLAQQALDNVSRRDPAKQYNKMTVAALQQLTPAFAWREYLQRTGAPALDSLNVAEPEFLRGFNATLTNVPLDNLKAYMRWHVARATAAVLPGAFVRENFRFYGTILQGTKELRPRWRRCVQFTDADLGEALGQAFVRDTFGERAKADTLAMVHEIQAALERDMNALDWMTAATKRQALAKLKAVENKIGYPDRWRDYSALQIVAGDAYGNSQRANVFEFRRMLDHIGKPVDKSEWYMTPPTVNAYYNPLENNINFPAGILQPPFYSAAADRAVNYGGAGTVIGHELTHGFDDEGRKFDGAGNMTDWWTADDAREFERRSSCLVSQYSGYTAIDDVKLNGQLTLGENSADNGGARLALLAYATATAGQARQVLDGFTPEQRFFVAFGQVWCENRRPDAERMRAVTDPHSPSRHRVNGVVSNMPEFQKAFSCKPDAPMVRAPACRVW